MTGHQCGALDAAEENIETALTIISEKVEETDLDRLYNLLEDIKSNIDELKDQLSIQDYERAW